MIEVVVYHHPHHPEQQNSSRQGLEYQQTYYRPTWNQKTLNIEVCGGLKRMHGEVKVAQ
jgi:hypothetical protein